MEFQRPLGCASGLRRSGMTLKLPTSRLHSSDCLKLRCLRRGPVCPTAAFGVSEALTGGWADAESIADQLPTVVHDGELLHSALPVVVAAVGSQFRAHEQVAVPGAAECEQLGGRHQQRHEAAQQVVQRLVPTTLVASTTKLPARGGMSAIGVALGMLLTVVLQLVGRWLQRQHWAQQLMELIDLRRSSGNSASTSGKEEGSDRTNGSTAAWWTTGRGDSRGFPSDAGGSPSGSIDGAYKSAFRGGVGGGGSGSTLTGTPLGTFGGVQEAGMAAGPGSAVPAAGTAAGPAASAATSASVLGPATDPGESVEWVNMCWRKVWRVYQRGLERWIIDLLQPVFDGLVKDGSVPRWLCRLRIVELTLDHEAPYFSNMRRRNSRKDSDLNGIVDLRYTGGARMLLLLELGEGRWRFKVPVLVSDLDLECQMWLKLRLAPMCPWIGTISLAFVGPPNVKVQLSPYNRVRLMRVPVVQNYLRKLLTVDLPALMVLPQRLEINIPPSVTTIAEAAVGRDTIMRAVASAVLQADAVEAALLAALPLGPQTPAGGVTLPDAFKGELSVALREARNLPVWGFPGQSNPYARLVLGDQAVQSRREGDTSHPGRHRAPVWNQEFQFLVEDAKLQVLEMLVKDSHLTGRTEVGRASIKLADLLVAQHSSEGGKVSMWVPLKPPAGSYGITSGEPLPTGEVLVELSYKSFDDDEHDSGCREAENYSKQATAQAPITDIRSAAAASSRAAVAASAAVSAIAMTRAAAARAAARAARVAQEAAAAAAGAAKGAVDQGASIIALQQHHQQQQRAVQLPKTAPLKPIPATEASTTSTTAAAAMAAAAAQSLHPAAVLNTELKRAAASLEPTDAAVATSSVPSLDGDMEAKDRYTAVVWSGRNGADAGSQRLAAAVGGAVAPTVLTPAVGIDSPGDSMLEDLSDADSSGFQAALSTLQPHNEHHARALTASAKVVVTAAALQSAKSATAVLERSPTPALHKLARGDGSSSRLSDNGHGPDVASVNHRQRLPSGNGGSDDKVTAATQLVPDDHNESNGSWNDANGAGIASASSLSPAAEVLGLRSHSDRTTVEMRILPSLPPRSPVYLPGENTNSSVDVEAAAMASSSHQATGLEGGSGASQLDSQGQRQASAAVAGSVLSALAHLTASAQSLTAAAIGKARESLSQKPPLPAAPLEGSPQQLQQVPTGDGEQERSSGDDGNWLAAIVARLPRYGGHGASPVHQHSRPEGEGRAGTASASSFSSSSVDGTADAGSSAGDDEHPWWQFWVPKDEATKLRETAGDDDGTSAAGSESRKSGALAESVDGASNSSGKPWWKFWLEKERDMEMKDGEAWDPDGDDRGNKPVEAIYISSDLPLEDIAAEVQRLKEDSWRERNDHVSNLWIKAVERNDRKWIMLAAFLLSVAVGLLTVVAWRLEHLPAAAPQIALMTMQAALQALQQHAISGGS